MQRMIVGAVLLAMLAGCGGGEEGDDSSGGGAAGALCESLGGDGVSTVSAGSSVDNPEALLDGRLDTHATITSAVAGSSSLRARLPGGAAAPAETSGGVLMDSPNSSSAAAITVTVQTYFMESPIASCMVYEAGPSNGNFTPCTTINAGDRVFIGAPSGIEYDQIEVIVQHLGSTSATTTRLYEICNREIDLPAL